MAKHILRLAPKHTTYCEPFLGGGATFWRHSGAKRYVLGDADPVVIQVWESIRTGKLFRDIEKAGCMRVTKANLAKAQTGKRTPLKTMFAWKGSWMARGKQVSMNYRNRLGACLLWDKLTHNAGKMQETVKLADVARRD